MPLTNQSVGTTPIWFKVARILTAIYALGGLVLVAAVVDGWYSSATPSSAYSFELRLRGEAHIFVTPILGYAVLTFIPVMGVLILILVRAEKRYKRAELHKP